MKFAGKIEPGIVSGVVTESKYIAGGYIVCQTVQEMESLKYGVKVNGLPCYVYTDNQLYRWTWDSDDHSQTGTGEWTLDTGSQEIREELDALTARVDAIEEVYLTALNVDNASIVCTMGEDDDELAIKGFTDALAGQMLVKDITNGVSSVKWVNPLSKAELDQAVADARAAAVDSSNYATIAGNEAASATYSAAQAHQSYLDTKNLFWFGSIAEYNDLESLDAGVIYCVTAGTVQQGSGGE